MYREKRSLPWYLSEAHSRDFDENPCCYDIIRTDFIHKYEEIRGNWPNSEQSGEGTLENNRRIVDYSIPLITLGGSDAIIYLYSLAIFVRVFDTVYSF